MGTVPFCRIAVVNRGEPAMRLLNAVAELNRQEGAGLRTIALYTEADRHALFVREADEAVCIGPATVFDPRLGARVHSYLDHGRLERALEAARAEAAWVGWGFVSEQAEFADLCQRLGVVFVGPPADVIRKVGDKIASKHLAEGAGVAVVPWSGKPVDHADQLREVAERLGYPVFVKAAAGGGGRGIRRVGGPAEAESALAGARAEAQHAFGDPTVFAERQVVGARHVEVQVIADAHGTVWAPGVRDCSLQRRNQKVIEESACTAMDAAGHERLRAAAVRLARAAGYRNAGTVEFLWTPEADEAWFMEVNARLQVEHPVTELTTGIDLVKLQLLVAGGGRLEGPEPAPSGHAIEARLNAEDPDRGFVPAPGRLRHLRLPAGPGIRVDTGVAAGDEIAPEFDSMIAKVVAWGRDREEARARLARALAQTTVVVEGGTTNKAFLLGLLDHPDVVAGRHDTGWIDRMAAAGGLLEHRLAEVALVCAAAEAYDLEHAVARRAFTASVARGRPVLDTDSGRRLEFCYHGRPCVLSAYRLGPGRYRVDAEGVLVDLEVEVLGEVERRVTVGGRTHRVVSAVHGPVHTVEVDGTVHVITRDEGGVVRAPAPGVVVSVSVGPGDQVGVGDPLAVLESMKMETVVSATFAGRVRSVEVTPNSQVGAGAPLVQLEPRPPASPGSDGGAEAATGPAPGDPAVADLHFGACAGPAADDGRGAFFAALRSYLLGYDLDPASTAGLLRRRREVVDGAPAADGELLALEDEVLALFADICAISRRQPDPGQVDGEAGGAPAEYLLAYLRSPERCRETLPRTFLDRLQRVVARYGFERLDRAPGLDDALFWLYRAQDRLGDVVPFVESMLDRRLGRVEELRPVVGHPERALLDHLADAARGRFPVVADLARELRYRCFEQPALEQARAEVYAAMDGHLAALVAGPPAEEREPHVTALVSCPHPLRARLLAWFRSGDDAARDVVLEVAARRYYRIRRLEDLGMVHAGDDRLAVAGYDHAGRRVHLVIAYASLDDLARLGQGIARHLAGVPGTCAPVIDLHLWSGGRAAVADVLAEQVRLVLEGAGFDRPVHRLDVTVSYDRPAPVPPVTHHVTFRQEGPRLVEESFYRNLHPMLAKRLDVGMLADFAVQRLPSGAEDVYLFHCVAHANPKDERLVALVEVRDLTPVRDAEGRVVGLPLVERLFLEAISGIRRFQSHRPPERRLFENQVILHIRPPWTIPADLWRELAHRAAPAAYGLGIERVVARVRLPDPMTGELRDAAIHVGNPGPRGVVVELAEPDREPLRPLTEYRQKVLAATRRGAVYPYEIVRLLTPAPGTGSDFPAGDFVEYDLDDAGRLVPVAREPGGNAANLVVGVVRNMTATVPEGMDRVLVAGDPSRGLGSLAEPECRRIIAALDLAERLGVPLEWFAVSSGARIAMTSGTENMDWIGAVLRRLVEFTQAGGEVNVVVTGINVGAQPYWNAEATMLMHTRGILVMTPQSAMVLTGKQALDFSGGVSAEDNFGIGGFERIMGPNGQGQYWAPDLESACEILLRHYEHAYVVRGERFPRRAPTTDPVDRDVRPFPHPPLEGCDFTTVGDVFSAERNAERKKPFDIRSVMRAVTDQDHTPLERWRRMSDADTTVVWDAFVGGIPVCLLGIESHACPREGLAPNDGPSAWTSGTLFPRSSKKLARALNSASGNRPVVVLANLSGFDGSPESMRDLQLELGAEIGRAVVNFRGPIVFVVVSRYHGGAFVVFSKTLSEGLEVAAVEGSYASVIGGAPAAAVVFSREVDTRTKSDPRVAEAQALADAPDADAAARQRLRTVTEEVRSAKLGEVAAEFEAVHDVQRALRVGSVDRIIAARDLRPYVVDAVERGMARELAGG
ncbi:MAG TPA: carboxyl transferase domain-containing protein [Acidimicrobiales bacterium]|nr:carboxyl transferase domain-containing protein [Acidimicrobiales bacterium]